MPRLPQPGSDNGTWGDILNEYLAQAHKTDGTIKDNAVTANTIAPNSVTNVAIASDAINATSIADGSIANNHIIDNTIQEAKLSASVQTKLNQTAPVTSVNTYTGAVTLNKTDIGLSDVDNTSDATKNSAIATLTNKTLTSPRINQILDTNGNLHVSLGAAPSAVNYVQIDNAVVGGAPGFYAAGTDTNISLINSSKGNGGIITRSTTNGIIMRAFGQVSGVNYIDVYNGAVNNPPTLRAAGADTNIGINLVPKGTGTVQANGIEVATVSGAQTLTNKTLTNPRINQIQDTNGYDILGVYGIPNAVNKYYITNQSAGNWPTIGADGADANIGVTFAPKGNASVRIFAPAGITPVLDVGGPDATIDLNIQTQGGGIVKANSVPVVTQVVVAPATASSAGIAGQIAYDADYFYQCIATDTWKRSPLTSW